jgi:hypothetical protein
MVSSRDDRTAKSLPASRQAMMIRTMIRSVSR